MVLLGEASALLGTRTLEELWTQSCATIEDFLMVVSEKHDVPLDQLCRADFRFALNGQLIAGDFSIVRSVSLEVGDELAIMPPVTGG
jgi:molybdopterin converting factor small subunit